MAQYVVFAIRPLLILETNHLPSLWLFEKDTNRELKGQQQQTAIHGIVFGILIGIGLVDFSHLPYVRHSSESSNRLTSTLKFGIFKGNISQSLLLSKGGGSAGFV